MVKQVKKVYISLIMFILTLLVFGTVSFAWISLATINNIDGLSITASSGNELEISIDGIHFANRLPTVELYELFQDIKLYDITTMDGINFYTGGLRTEGPAVPNEHYLTFDLWFRTIRQENGIYLVNNVSQLMSYDDQMEGTYVVSRGVSWTAKHGFFNGPTLSDYVEQGTTDVYYASDALRIGIQELQVETNQLDTRNPSDLKVFIYDPSENPFRGFGESFGAFSYFFQRTHLWIWLPTEKPVTSYRLTLIDPQDPYQALDNDSLIAELILTDETNSQGQPYYMAKIRVNIWIEGWDADAFDALDKDMVKIQLQFKALRTAD